MVACLDFSCSRQHNLKRNTILPGILICLIHMVLSLAYWWGIIDVIKLGYDDTNNNKLERTKSMLWMIEIHGSSAMYYIRSFYDYPKTKCIKRTNVIHSGGSNNQ